MNAFIQIHSCSVLPALVLAIVLAGCSSQAQEATLPDATPVKTATVQQSTSADLVHTVGTVKPASTVDLSFKIGGPIGRILVDVGDRVNAGDILAELQTAEIDAAVRQATAARDKAQRDFDRMSRLYADSVVTLAQFQDAQTGLDVATAQFESAQFNRTYATITAQTDGRVMERKAEPGQMISAGKTVLSLGATSQWIVAVSLSDMDAANLSVGDQATLKLDAFPGQSIEGRLIEIAEIADARSGTFRAEIVLRSSLPFRAGFVARASIQPSASIPRTVIPSEALVRANGHSGEVFVMNTATGTAEARAIQIGTILSDGVTVTEGLQPGEEVITDGAAYVSDGAPVALAR